MLSLFVIMVVVPVGVVVYGEADVAADRRELVHAVGAGVTLHHRAMTVRSEFLRPVAIIDQGAQMPPHLGAVARHEEVFTRREPPLVVAPWCGDERHLTGQRLERPDRRNARHRLHIGTPRHMHRRAELRKHLGHAIVRGPTTVGDAGLPQTLQGHGRITHTVHARAQLELSDGLHQKLFEFGTALFVAPITDPHHVSLTAFARVGEKCPRVAGLVPDPCALGPAAREIDVTQHAAEGEHTIVVTQVVTRHVFWLGQRTMVGIVKQEARTRMGGAIFADTTHELMIVPFVHDDEVGAVDQLAALVLLFFVKVALEKGKVPMKVGARARSLLAEELGETPSAVRFIYLHLVPARLEFAHHATQEVGIAVIPVGHQRVIEHLDTHGWPSLADAHAYQRASSAAPSGPSAHTSFMTRSPPCGWRIAPAI